MLKKTQIKSSANIFLKLLGAFFIFWNSWKLRYYCFESNTKKRQLTFGLIRQLCQSRKRLNNIAHFLSKNDLNLMVPLCTMKICCSFHFMILLTEDGVVFTKNLNISRHHFVIRETMVGIPNIFRFFLIHQNFILKWICRSIKHENNQILLVEFITFITCFA